MKNTFSLLGIIALVAVIGLSFAACKSDDNSVAGGTTYKWAASGLTQTEWDTYFIGTDPDDLINEDSSSGDLNGFYTEMSGDNDGSHGVGATAAFIKDALAEQYNSTYANAVVAKLEEKGWVFAATTINVGEGDYADIFLAIKE